jgi:outer membrane protein assembly factor BamB
MVESAKPEIAERTRRRDAARTRRRQVARNRALALVLAAATLVVVTLVSRNGPGPATLLSAVGSGPGHLDAGSQNALQRNILVADGGNNRLVVISPAGQVAWSEKLFAPTEVFVSPTRSSILVTQSGLSAILKYGIISGDLYFHYGQPGQPGAGYDELHSPQAAHQLADGRVVVADESNCRVLFLEPPSRQPVGVLGRTGSCVHDPPATLSYPDSVFPTSGSALVLTERRPAWVDVLTPAGTLITALRLRGLSAPTGANEFAPGKLVITGQSDPGAVEELTTAGTLLWRFAPASGPGELRFPSLAQVLADGDVLVSDTGNDRIVVIDPHSGAIVWQYGHTRQPGSHAGFLNAPESAVLVP